MVLVELPPVLSQAPACYWIDRDETSVAEYDRFVAANARAPFDWASVEYCGWKDGGAPSDPAGNAEDECRRATADEDIPQFGANKPIRCIDWCDARAYCQSLDKQLCVSAGNMPGNKAFVPQVSGNRKEFDWACGAVPNDPYPSGLVYDGTCRLGGKCVVVGIVSRCGPLERDESPGCVSGSGARNLLGNVREWIDSCRVDGLETGEGRCYAGGYSYLSTGDRTCFVADEAPKARRTCRESRSSRRCRGGRTRARKGPGRARTFHPWCRRSDCHSDRAASVARQTPSTTRRPTRRPFSHSAPPSDRVARARRDPSRHRPNKRARGRRRRREGR